MGTEVERYEQRSRARMAELNAMLAPMEVLPPPAPLPAPRAEDRIRDPRPGDMELRSPSAATQLQAYLSPGTPMVPEWDAEGAIRWAYLANVYVFACVKAIARDVARLPFRMGADPDRPNDFDPNHPLAKLLSPPPGGPTPNVTVGKLLAWSVAQRIVSGRFGWEIERDDRSDLPIGLWPLVSYRLRPIPADGGIEWFTGFEYGTYVKPRRLKVDDVFYVWEPAQTSWIEPESQLQAARLDISVAVMQDRYDVAFLRNDARPAAVVVHQAFAEKGQKAQFRAQWAARYGGPDNAGRVAFAEAGKDLDASKSLMVQTIGLSQRDAEFAKRYEAKVRAICVDLGVPMSRLGDASDRTFSNAGEEGLNYWQDTVYGAHASPLADEINLHLAPLFDQSNVGWFDVRKIRQLRPPKRFMQVSPVDLLKVGAVLVDEVRDDIELPAMTEEQMAEAAAFVEANKPVPPPQLQPAAPPEPIPPPTPPPPPARARRDDPQPVDKPVDPAEERAALRARLAEDRAKVWRATDAHVRTLRSTWERRFQALLDRQRDATVARLTGKRGRQAMRAGAPDPAAVFDRNYWRGETYDEVLGLYQQAATAAGLRVADHFGLAFDLSAPGVDRFVQERANRLAGLVTDTTYGGIKDALDQAVEDGLGIDEMADLIRGLFDQTYGHRAETVARTEVLSAYNGAANAAALDLPDGIVAGKEWIATADDRTRDDHANADGQQVGLDEPFDVGGEQLDYPGDPAGSPENTVNCRCTPGYLTPDEVGQRAMAREPVPFVPYEDVERMLVLVARGATAYDAAVREVRSLAVVA